MHLPLGLSVCVFVSISLRLCVFAVLSLFVLCEEASVGCCSISSGSSCLECSLGGAVCPAADAALALATWT